jgi:phosphate transport system substrate-binding protein
MKISILRPILACAAFTAIFSSCGNNGKAPLDTPTSGTITIGVEESYAPLMDTEIYTFGALYKNAHINPYYKPEAEIVQDLLDDSIRLAVIGRDLTDEEKEYFKKKTHPAFTTKIAVDAIALIINPGNTDSLMTLSRVKDIFAGRDTTWSQVNPSSALGKINIVFDNNGSANYRYISQELLGGKPVNPNSFAMKNNAEVIEYVSRNKNAIGVISIGWISDRYDTTAQNFLQKIRVVAVSEFEAPPGSDEYKKPYQAWIYNKTYPLRRDVYVIKIGTRSGLGTGFAAHLAGEKGQLIIHKQGMVAAQSPTRLVEINQE